VLAPALAGIGQLALDGHCMAQNESGTGVEVACRQIAGLGRFVGGKTESLGLAGALGPRQSEEERGGCHQTNCTAVKVNVYYFEGRGFPEGGKYLRGGYYTQSGIMKPV